MQVRCSHCGAQYQFDDVRVGNIGVTVKCTRCSRPFEVRPIEAEHLGPPTLRDDRGPWDGDDPGRVISPDAPAPWQIRRGDGQTLEFDDFQTLQKWIIERRVSRKDLVSKSGESWRPLGGIVELSTIFLAVDDSGGGPRQSVVMRPPGTAPSPMTPNEVDGGAVGGPGDVMIGTHRYGDGDPVPGQLAPGQGLGPGGQEPPSRPPAAAPAMSLPNELSTVTGRPSDWSVKPPAGTAMPIGRDLETVGRPSMERSRGAWRTFAVGLFLVCCVAVGGFFLWQHYGLGGFGSIGAVEPTGNAQSAAQPNAFELRGRLDEAHAAYLRDREEQFAQAATIYESVLKQLGDPPTDPVLAARAWRGWAAVAIARAEYALVAGNPHQNQLAQAETFLGRASKLVPVSGDYDLLRADYYRVAGQPDFARRYVDKLVADGVDRPDLVLVRTALGLHRGNSPKTVAEHLANLPPAAAKLPRAGFLTAEAWRKAGDIQRAIMILEIILKSNPDHGPAKALLERLRQTERDSARAPAPTSAPAGGAGAAPRAISERSRSQGDPGAASKPSGVVGGSFDSLMARGDKLLMAGKSAQAVKYFKRASVKAPNRPEPIANLGWCAQDRGNHVAAIGHFKRALKAHARYADAQFGLAMAYEKNGDRDSAKAAFETYLRQHPRGRSASIVKRKLERLR